MASFQVGANTHYAARYGLIPGSIDQADQQKAYWMTDANATYSAENGRWEVELWVVMANTWKHRIGYPRQHVRR